MAPVGPVVLFGLLGLAAGLLVLACARFAGFPNGAVRTLWWLRWSSLMYAGVVVAVWISGWVASVAGIIHS